MSNICKTCEKVIRSVSGALQHVDKMHPLVYMTLLGYNFDRVSEGHKCKTCYKVIPSFGGAFQHWEKMHSESFYEAFRRFFERGRY